MFAKLLTVAEELVLRRPGAVIAVVAVASVVGLVLGAGLDLRTARGELVPEGDALQTRWNAVRAEFTDPEPLIVALERTSAAVDVGTLEAIADAIALELQARPEFDSVFYRIDLDWLAEHALHLAPPGQLRRAIDEIEALLTDHDGTVRAGNLERLNTRLAERVARDLASATGVSDEAEQDAARLAMLLAGERDFLRAPVAWTTAREPRLLDMLDTLDAEGRGSLTANGYLSTDDESLVLLLANLSGEAAGLERQQRAVARARLAAAEAIGDVAGVRFGLTGPPAMDVEEMATVARDGQRSSLTAIVGVGLLALLAFHRARHAALGVLALAAGVTWSVAAVALQLGYLNLITTALVPILVGMGIDYAVHPISQYEIERRSLARLDAVRATFRKTARPVLVSGLTTAAAFFCFLFMQFKGFAELGLVTGTGVLLCLLAAFLAVPALLAVAGAGHRAERAAAVDRVWDMGASSRICATPRWTIGIAVVATLATLPLVGRVGMNNSLLELLPAEADSLRLLEIINARSAVRGDFNLVLAEDLAQLRRFDDRARSHPEIARFESVLTFLPEDPVATTVEVQRLARLLDRTEVRGTASTPDSLIGSLERLAAALSEAADAAFVTGRGEAAAQLDTSRALADGMADALRTAAAAHLAAVIRGEALAIDWVGRLLGEIATAAGAALPSVESLPAPLRQRFVTRDGRLVGYMYPVGSIHDRGSLEPFNAASTAVSPDAVGFPMVFEAHSRLITAGFGTTLLAGGLLVVLLVLLDLRNVGDVMLALLPVALGTTWLLAAMGLAGLQFNLANMVAIPIVLGVGIDAGVHMVHRARLEGAEGMAIALAHTGRAILVASLTTMVGFGSLAFASHRGMASLGVLLFLGVGGCMLAALVVLPNLMLVPGRSRG